MSHELEIVIRIVKYESNDADMDLDTLIQRNVVVVEYSLT